jgi:hypothetical protein
MKLINSTPNGQIFMCPCQNKLQIEFGNLFLLLTYDEFNFMNDYVKNIDYKHFLNINRNAQNRRKLLLFFGKSSAYLALHENEFLEFKALISLKNEGDKLTSISINTSDINLN